MKITRKQLRRIISEEIDRSISEAEVIDFPKDPKLPWEFGPEGYLKRPELSQKMSDLEYGSDSPPEWILAIALSNRAEEMLGYKQTVDPNGFSQLAMNIYQDYVVDKAGNIDQSLDDITSRIDAGDYFDEDIGDVMDAAQMTKTKERSSHQDPESVRSMEDEVEDMADAYMQGNVIDLYDDDK